MRFLYAALLFGVSWGVNNDADEERSAEELGMDIDRTDLSGFLTV